MSYNLSLSLDRDESEVQPDWHLQASSCEAVMLVFLGSIVAVFGFFFFALCMDLFPGRPCFSLASQLNQSGLKADFRW